MTEEERVEEFEKRTGENFETLMTLPPLRGLKKGEALTALEWLTSSEV